MRLFKWLTLLLSLIVSQTVNSQNLSVTGKITDEKGNPIPFATVFVKEISKGLSTGDDGVFNLVLKPGNYTFKVQSIGFKPEIRSIKLSDKNINLTVKLHDLSYELKEVVISGKENPANRIMRAAIARGAYYKKLLKYYDAEVYVKSGQKLERISDMVKLLTKNEKDMPKIGELSFAESYNRVVYEAPDKFTQTVLRTQSTEKNKDEREIPGVGFLTTDFFSPTVMNSPSPMGKNAFSSYNFSLEGISNLENQAIYKIKISPKRPGLFFKGYAYIESKNYLLKNLDLDFEFSFINFNIKIDFEEMKGEVVLPGTFFVKFKASIMGNEFSGTTNSSINYKQIIIDSSFRYPAGANLQGKPSADTLPKSVKGIKEEKLQKDIDQLLAKPDMTLNDMNRFMRLMKKQEKLERKDSVVSLEVKDKIKILKDSLYSRYDTAWWQEKRPVPLNNEEGKAKQRIDSLVVSEKNIPYKKDTLLPKHPFAWYKIIGRLFLGGDLYADSTVNFSTGGISLSSSYFSPVDGFTLAERFDVKSKSKNKKNAFEISAVPMYSFERQDFMFDVNGWLKYSDKKPGKISVNLFSVTNDFNTGYPVNKTINTISTLIFHQNFLKQIHEDGMRLRNENEVINGLTAGIGFDMISRQVLENQSKYSFKYHDSIYPENVPNNTELRQFPLKNHKHTILYFMLQYQPRNKYRISEGRKINLGSDYPLFKAEFYQGINTPWTVDIAIEKLDFTIQQVFDMGIFTNFRYLIKTGTFMNTHGLQFSEFYHPSVEELPFATRSMQSAFFLVPNYSLSTFNEYLDVHAQYESTCIVFKRLPWLSKKLVTEKVGFSYFSKKSAKYYTEVYYGLSKIFFGGEALVILGFKEGKYSGAGVKFCFSF